MTSSSGLGSPELAPRPGGVSLGRIVLAAILISVGVVWLLDATEVVDVSWGALLPAALIVVGLALIAGSRTGRHGGLIALGVVLTLVLAFTASLNLPLSGGVGDRTYRPGSLGDVPGTYELAIGSLKVDLTDLELPGEGTTTVRARVGMGEIQVTVPDGLCVEVRGKVTAGDVQVFDAEDSGLGVNRTFRCEEAAGEPVLFLDLSAGFGSIKVDT